MEFDAHASDPAKGQITRINWDDYSDDPRKADLVFLINDQGEPGWVGGSDALISRYNVGIDS